MPIIGDLSSAVRRRTLDAKPEELSQYARDLRRQRMRLVDQGFGRRASLEEFASPENPMLGASATHRPGRRLWNESPLVSVVIPTRADIRSVRGKKICLAQNAIESLLSSTVYPLIEVIVVLDVPNEAPIEFLEIFKDERVICVPYREPFSFADKCNEGFLHARGHVTIFLNDDTEIVDPNWMQTLVDLVNDETVGLVGPLLLLEDGRVQSAGHTMYPSPRNLLVGTPLDEPSVSEFLTSTRRVSGLTAACVAVRSDIYESVGGMSDIFPVNFNDVDLGLKLLTLGYVHVWTGQTRVFHFESLTRSTELESMDEPNLRARWNRYFSADPYASIVASQ